MMALTQGLKHAGPGPHVARESILCGPWCFSVIFKYLKFTLFSSFTGVYKCSFSERTSFLLNERKDGKKWSANNNSRHLSQEIRCKSCFFSSKLRVPALLRQLHNVALGLLYKSSFGPPSNLSLRPCFNGNALLGTHRFLRWIEKRGW